jgi:hypothetical protein
MIAATAHSSGSGASVLLLLIVIFWILPIFVASRLGRKKLMTTGWAWGFFLGWLGVIIVATRPNQVDFKIVPQAPSSSVQTMPPSEKKCPMCAEFVKASAKVCRFCKHEFLEVAE